MSDTLETHRYDFAPDYIRVSRDPHAHTRIRTDSHTATNAVRVELEFSTHQTQQVVTIWSEQPLGAGLALATVPAHWLPPLLDQLRRCMPMADAPDDEWYRAIYGLTTDQAPDQD